ncbi:unnamed protein product [Mytilus coruscus]|uniref:CCHC-type domain-containing protein n=1 Tax=Mytilus coruscus TaxID=42192 RepID=A0A6J8D3A6_MYTCO|nr:unnamed protein product [Mytilus coruscus]
MSSGNVQTLTSLPNYTPRISTFFGELGKGEATYDSWRYEVDSLRKSTFAPHIVDLLIRRSLRGEAEKVAMRLGPEALLDQLLNKLEEFYSAKQKPNEDITAWANRLEDLLYKASKQKLVRTEDINDKLCSMFWSGLDPKLREISGHLHFLIKDFDKLKLAMREQEVEFKKEARPQPAKMMIQTGTDDNTQSEFTSMLHQLIADVKDLKERDTQYSNKYQNNNRDGSNFRNSNTNYRGNRSNYHNQGNISIYQNQGNRSNYQNQGQRSNYQNQGQGANYQNSSYGNNVSSQSRREFTPDGIPVCWRCGQEGHKAYGCFVRLDNNRKAGLNSNRSALRGK